MRLSRVNPKLYACGPPARHVKANRLMKHVLETVLDGREYGVPALAGSACKPAKLSELFCGIKIIETRPAKAGTPYSLETSHPTC